MTTRREQLGITGRKMYEGEKINPSTDLPKFLNTNKATETGAQPSGKDFSEQRDEAERMRQYVREVLASLPSGLSSPAEICNKFNQTAPAQTIPNGRLVCKAEYSRETTSFYFSFLINGKNLHSSLGPVSAEEVFKFLRR